MKLLPAAGSQRGFFSIVLGLSGGLRIPCQLKVLRSGLAASLRCCYLRIGCLGSIAVDGFGEPVLEQRAGFFFVAAIAIVLLSATDVFNKVFEFE